MIAQQATQCPWRRPVETVPEPKNYGRAGVKARSREFICDTNEKMQNAKLLIESVERLYKVFSRYPLHKHVEGCPCCVHETDKRALEAKPLRQLTSSDLGRYAFKAMTTWGGKDDFRHFLPRIFELLVSEKGMGWDEEVILGKLALAEWKQWPEQEKTAVRDFFHAGWNTLLSQPQPSIEPDSWLCGLGRADEDLQLYLDDWTSLRTANAYDHLAKFVEWHHPTYVKRHSLNNPFWPDSPHGVAQVCDWLSSRQTCEKLERIYLESEAADFAPALARAIEQLELIAKA
jgi:hypothetical protein